MSRFSNTIRARGEPMLWMTGGGLALALVMIVGLLGLVFYQGATTFWPAPLVRLERHDGPPLMGEVTRHDRYRPRMEELAPLPEEAGAAARSRLEDPEFFFERRLLRTGNFELSGTHFNWVSAYQIRRQEQPEWAVVFERMAWGRFYGEPVAFLKEGEVAAEGAAEAWNLFRRHHAEVRQRWNQRRRLEIRDIGRVNHELEKERLRLRALELREPGQSPAFERARAHFEQVRQKAEREFEEIREQINRLNRINDGYRLRVATASGQTVDLALADIVRAYPANRMSLPERAGVYFSRWWEFLSANPREANSEGGVFPVIFGTVTMTMLMSLLVVPFGVLAALYLREYARAGPLVSSVRIAIFNLAGVPSIVFGVFGLGFFCYIMGGTIDQLFFQAKLPNPTYGTGGILWASLTLALLTLPVVIVATEEALAAVPGSMREASYACGASKWQTIRRVVLPRAMPGIMTGMILAMARGAGEVAPLMLVGAVKLAPELPVDGVFPYIHPHRSFMHLGFHIFDLGFQSQNSEAAKPMVFTTTLLLISLVAAMNMTAVWLRTRLRRRFLSSHF